MKTAIKATLLLGTAALLVHIGFTLADYYDWLQVHYVSEAKGKALDFIVSDIMY